MLGVSLETGILRANICCYVADMEDKKTYPASIYDGG